MGGKSSKAKKDSKKKKKLQIEPPPEPKQDDKKEPTRPDNTSKIMKDDFNEVVHEALRANFDLVTLKELDYYISTRYTMNMSQSERKRIILNVVSELFYKGCLAIRAK